MEKSTMLFNTPQFVLTFIALLVCWYILPNSIKKPVLLIFSYFFAYNLGNLSTMITLAVVTMLTYFFAILLEKYKCRKIFIFVFIALLVSLLIYEKYLPLIPNINSKITFLSMVGVSYYVFSAISYISDVLHGKDNVDRNLLDLALWMAFFPKFTAGPIERHKQFKLQLQSLCDCKFDFERVKRGLLICACGYFYKIIIADRISPFVDTVYSDVLSHKGSILWITMILYSLQIYFDFAGYSLIAYGISYSLDLRIMKNFDHPYFSESVTEFWRRWHISLSTWLRDYVYIPLGGNRKGKFRQYINIMITFLISGAWHGAGLNFIIWGATHGLFQIIENRMRKLKKLPAAINRTITFLFISGTWIIFRADSFRTAKYFIKRMLQWDFQEIKESALTSLGLDFHDWIVLLIALTIVGIIELLQYNNVSVYEKLQKQKLIIRWITYYLIIIILIIFGIYGTSYDASKFIYSNF